MVLMLIDTRRDPPPPSEPDRHRHWSFDDWRRFTSLGWGIVLVLLSSVFPPLPAYILLVGACVLIVRGLERIVGDAPGLRDYRQ
jgi:hypothetical protein